DEVAVPAGLAQLSVHRGRPVAALAGDDRVVARQRRNVARVLQRAGRPADVGALAAGRRGREERRLDVIEVPLLEHSLHEDRAHHAPPTHYAYSHGITPSSKSFSTKNTKEKRRSRRFS